LPTTNRQDIARRAAELIGKEELAVRLKVAQSLLDAWIGGHATMPDRMLMRLVDILNEQSKNDG
jgi:hypothetical protein